MLLILLIDKLEAEPSLLELTPMDDETQKLDEIYEIELK